MYPCGRPAPRDQTQPAPVSPELVPQLGFVFPWLNKVVESVERAQNLKSETSIQIPAPKPISWVTLDNSYLSCSEKMEVIVPSLHGCYVN